MAMKVILANANGQWTGEADVLAIDMPGSTAPQNLKF